MKLSERPTTRGRAKPPPVIRPGWCGSIKGYNKHHREGERPCQPCLDANRAYRRELTARRFVPADQRTEPTDTGACGSPKGYQRHHAAGEHACPACLEAMNERQHDYYHHQGGAEVQRRRRRTETYRRTDREHYRRRQHQRQLDRLTLTEPESSRWRRALNRLTRRRENP